MIEEFSTFFFENCDFLEIIYLSKKINKVIKKNNLKANKYFIIKKYLSSLFKYPLKQQKGF